MSSFSKMGRRDPSSHFGGGGQGGHLFPEEIPLPILEEEDREVRELKYTYRYKIFTLGGDPGPPSPGGLQSLQKSTKNHGPTGVVS